MLLDSHAWNSRNEIQEGAWIIGLENAGDFLIPKLRTVDLDLLSVVAVEFIGYVTQRTVLEDQASLRPGGGSRYVGGLGGERTHTW